MSTGRAAPKRIWMPRIDALYAPNASFYTTKDNPDDVEYVLAIHFDEVVASAREVLKQIDGSSTGAVNTEATEALREALAAVKTDSGNEEQT